MVQWHSIWLQMLRGCILVSPGPQSSPTGPYLGGISTHPTSNPNSSCYYPRPLNIYNITLLTTLYPLCQLTCYNKVTTNADTRQATSWWGEVSCRGPCGGASGPGLGGGHSVGSSPSSAHDIHLHSDTQNVVVCTILGLGMISTARTAISIFWLGYVENWQGWADLSIP